MLQPKMSRKRVANFTPHEKAVLTLLIKRRPIIQSKSNDGKSVAKKQAAWATITQEFNSTANVHKRETITLKRAWDNMKAVTRKVRASERSETNASPPQYEPISNIVGKVVPAMFCEIKNTLDSDGGVSDVVDSSQELDLDETFDISEIDKRLDSEENMTFKAQEDSDIINSQDFTQSSTDSSHKIYPAARKSSQVHRPLSYIAQDVAIQMEHLQNKRKVEVEILQTRLEFEQIKKRTALLEEERSKILLEKAIIELEEVMKSTNTTLELAE